MIELLSDVTADICFQLRVSERVSFVSTFESFLDRLFENPSSTFQIPNPKAIEFMSNRCFQQKTFYVIAKLPASFSFNFFERRSFNFPAESTNAANAFEN